MIAPGEAVVACSGLEKSFGGRVAVDGVSLSIASGEAYGLLGPNGAGKTTTISMLAGLLAPDGGWVDVCGVRLDHGREAVEARRFVGYVPQEVALYPELSLSDNLDFFAKLYRMGRRERGLRSETVLAMVGLADRRSTKVGTFSGGMKRRANIAVGLIAEPRLLILDEPTVGVDPQSRNAILTTVRELVADGLGVLFSTHYMEEAAKLCDRIGIIDAGRLISEGTPGELTRSVTGPRRVRLRGDAGAMVEALETGEDVTVVDEGTVDVAAQDPAGRLPELVARLSARGIEVRGAAVTAPDLEDVFLGLTGRELRD